MTALSNAVSSASTAVCACVCVSAEKMDTSVVLSVAVLPCSALIWSSTSDVNPSAVTSAFLPDSVVSAVVTAGVSVLVKSGKGCCARFSYLPRS